jgi:hypothetical protein
MRNLTKNDVGKKFTAEIQGVSVKGRVQFESGRFYLCQNEKNGSNCIDKLGYKFSWTIGDGSIRVTKLRDVKNLVMNSWTSREIEEYKDFQPGDVLIRPRTDYDRKVVHKFEEFLLTADIDDGRTKLLTADDLYEAGWRVKMEAEEEKEEVVEMSVAEVAKKLGISVESLKIVDK